MGIHWANWWVHWKMASLTAWKMAESWAVAMADVKVGALVVAMAVVMAASKDDAKVATKDD